MKLSESTRNKYHANLHMLLHTYTTQSHMCIFNMSGYIYTDTHIYETLMVETGNKAAGNAHSWSGIES